MTDKALRKDPYNIVITGVGGQGNVMASRVLANMLVRRGFRVTMTPSSRPGPTLRLRAPPLVTWAVKGQMGEVIVAWSTSLPGSIRMTPGISGKSGLRPGLTATIDSILVSRRTAMSQSVSPA